ncbi:hypothetical protein GCM10023194_71740 [Planotetraspora phitsanulokensis]|uniref:Uncharacterized protein n=1 Tax=Planotetraspora phitsanulokensis TaxID=575192 RepID=A0A8J3XDI2_9ACTN|nr:hypothetical protein Pph01_23300 [Planotetraspora phitsanulokensis]
MLMRAERGEPLLTEGEETQGGALGAVGENSEMPHRDSSPFRKPYPIGLPLAQILVDAGTPAFVGPRKSP